MTEGGLNLDPHLTHADEVFALWVEANEGLALAESHALSARLVLILMNHIGDPRVIVEAIAAAKR